MADIIITNDPNAITAPSPGGVTLISEQFQESKQKQTETLAQAEALTYVGNGTIIYVAETDTYYLKGPSGLRAFVLSDPAE